MELFEESERVKIRFLAAFDRLLEKGLLTAAERDEVFEIIDGMDDLPAEEFTSRLRRIKDQVEARAAARIGRRKEEGV